MTGDKEAIRNILRERKQQMSPEERYEKSLRICHLLKTLISLDETVMVYTSKEHEVNTMPLITDLLAADRRVIVPVIESRDISLRLSYLEDPGVLIPGTFGVPEPIGNEIPADGADIDLIILPMLGFDRKGRRIGYGAGYYDRFLARHPGIRRIGIAFSCQEMDELPSEPHDGVMDLIVTEDGVISVHGDDPVIEGSAVSFIQDHRVDR